MAAFKDDGSSGPQINMRAKRKKRWDEHAEEQQAVVPGLRKMASKSATPTSPFVFQPGKGGM